MTWTLGADNERLDIHAQPAQMTGVRSGDSSTIAQGASRVCSVVYKANRHVIIEPSQHLRSTYPVSCPEVSFSLHNRPAL